MNFYNTDELRALCDALDCRAFEQQLYKPGPNAQANLTGRTYYVHPDTLRLFHSRVTDTRVLRDGAFFLIVERTALDPRNTTRGSRVVVFDLTGQTVYRPSLAETHRTSAQAIKAFYVWWNEFDPVQHYARVLASQAARGQEQADKLRALADQYSAPVQVTA